jgi:hypothetical protein
MFSVRYRRDEISISITLFMTFDIHKPSISHNDTFDIEHLRYRHTISKVQNVDIEWAFDIEVFDIECDARYRRSAARYRGGKDPDDVASALQALPVCHGRIIDSHDGPSKSLLSLRMVNGMVPVSPTGTSASLSLPNIEVMGTTYRTSLASFDCMRRSNIIFESH